MSIRLDDGTDLGEDQKKIIYALDSPEFYFIFCIDQDYLYFLLAIVRPN